LRLFIAARYIVPKGFDSPLIFFASAFLCALFFAACSSPIALSDVYVRFFCRSRSLTITMIATSFFSLPSAL
jgi:SNF family Na+-dependent transporter